MASDRNSLTSPRLASQHARCDEVRNKPVYNFARWASGVPPAWALVTFGLTSACLLAWAQPPLGIAWLGVIGAAPWLWSIQRRGAAFATGLSFSFGTTYGCLVALWIPEALEALGSSNTAAVTGWILTAAWAKGAPVTAVGLTVWSVRRAPPMVQVFGCAAAFYGYTLFVSSWPLGIPWALLGHSQLALPGVAQLAVVGGVPLLSAWLGSINMAFVVAIRGNAIARRLAIGLASSWLVTIWLGFPVAQMARPLVPETAEIEFLVVQPEIPRYARWDSGAQPWILETVASYTTDALAGQPSRVDAIVWPENLLTTPLDTNSVLSRSLQRQVDQWDVPLIAGLVRFPTSRVLSNYRSSILWIEPEKGIVHAVDKERAIPLIESSRNLLDSRTVELLFGRAAQWPKVEEARDVGALKGSFEVVPTLCYETLFPGLVADRRGPESVAILNLADDSWVTGEALTRQLVDIAAFRAIEQRLTLIRVAHGGLSAVISPFGERLAELPLDTYANATVSVSPSPPPSLSERLAIAALPALTGAAMYWLSGFMVKQRGEPGRE